jgi:cystathionine beta-lyase/cystathionine gamma-synthase
MKGACGLMTFIVNVSSIDKIEKFCEDLKHIKMAVSWGGHESLIIPRCAGIHRADFDINNEQHRMIRIYAGLEEPDYIIEDLRQAFDKI